MGYWWSMLEPFILRINHPPQIYPPENGAKLFSIHHGFLGLHLLGTQWLFFISLIIISGIPLVEMVKRIVKPSPSSPIQCPTTSDIFRWRFPEMRDPPNGWFIRGNPMCVFKEIPRWIEIVQIEILPLFLCNTNCSDLFITHISIL